MITLKIRFAFRLFITALVCTALIVMFFIQVRYTAAVAGLLPTLQANAYSWSEGAPKVMIGSNGTIRASYCSEIIALRDASNRAGLTSTTLRWDDAWFTGDSRTYNHGIATASAILSAVCNSESQFYGRVKGAVPYAEQTLGQLGFTHIQTESYALRSNTFDQIGALFAGSHDVAAYTLASKSLTDASGRPQGTLIFVGIRGSYGIEWLSNLKLSDNAEDAPDHYGFKSAEQEVIEALSRYVEQIGIDARHAQFLITGHSRGGSIANLLAADLSKRNNQLLSSVPNSNVYVYTFAAPCTTLASDRNGRQYANIFNILNPTDIVLRLPLEDWGYGRYGTVVSLPDIREAHHHSSYTAMQAVFSDNTGYVSPIPIDELDTFDSPKSRGGTAASSMIDLITPMGMAAAWQSVVGVDFNIALTSHYPDTYIAWLQSIDSQMLLFS